MSNTYVHKYCNGMIATYILQWHTANNGYTNTLKLSVYLPPIQLIHVTGLAKEV